MSASDRDSVVLLSAGYYETAVVLAKRVCSLEHGTLVHNSGPRADAAHDRPTATRPPTPQTRQ